MKKLVMHSGGMDSTAMMMDYINIHGAENVISLGFNYGQRHFKKENEAATRFCEKHGVKRVVLDVPISQIGGCSLIDHNIDVTTDMAQQRSTVVPQRNAIFCLFAAAFAQENDCDTIVHGACIEDYEAYRDCRSVFFNLLEQAIQAGRTNPIRGSENIANDYITDGVIDNHKLDIKIDTPLIQEKKEETVARIVENYGIDCYKHSYTCYNGGEVQCGRCPACVERQVAFFVNGVKDPLSYENPLSEEEMQVIVNKTNTELVA